MKQYQLKTKRLTITPMTEAELAACGEAETDAHMKQAYAEMLAGVREDPAHWIWHTEWRISLRASGVTVGGAGFKGEPKRGEVELGYGIDEAQRGNGYAREAAEALCGWAFDHGAYTVIAEAEKENAASQGVLKACGFSCTGAGKEGERWEKPKPKTQWLAICMCMGLSIGCSMGVAFGSAGGSVGTAMCIGMCAGLGIGTAIGASLDAADQKTRAAFAANAETQTPEETAANAETQTPAEAAGEAATEAEPEE